MLAIARTYVTCFGIGFIPKGSGTAASAVAIIFWTLLFRLGVERSWLLVINVILIIISIPLIRIYEGHTQSHDSSEIVIDEWVGMGLALLPTEFRSYEVLAAFILFRIFDIKKPLGIAYFDRNYLRGWGVMLDDVVAGIYSALLIGVSQWLYVHYLS